MGSNLVIVALPREEEVVNQVSSEKAAHVTLLFLGEQDDISADIMQFVEHAVTTSFEPMYLEVSDRGTLGPDEADVLFFAGPGARRLEEFRSLLLKDDNIRRLYDEQEQYPGFTPHLTLGYPETPPNPVPEGKSWGLQGVEVDRIAVWTEDSDGPEFKAPYREYTDAAGWGDKPKDGSLWHYGKKGMKWGVINEERPTGRTSGGTATTPGAPTSGGPKAGDGKNRKYKEGEGLVGPGGPTGKGNPKRGFPHNLSTGQKVAIGVGVSYIALRLAAPTVIKTIDSGKVKAFRNRDQIWKKDLSLTKKGMSVSDLSNKVMKPINPDYGEAGTMMNCRRCTLTYELRRRGYDLKATRSMFATGQDANGMIKATKNSAKFDDLLGLGVDRVKFNPPEQAKKLLDGTYDLTAINSPWKANDVFKSLERYPNGARGELTATWYSGGGHSMIWEIVNNKPVIMDGQTKQVYEFPAQFKDIAEQIQDAGHTRLDNLPLDENWLKRWSENA